MEAMKIEALLRICVTLLFLITACVVRFDTQTKTLFYSFTRKATFRDLNVLFILVFIESAAAAYNMLQLVKCLLSSSGFKGDTNGLNKNIAWACFLLDQAVVYITFAANTAAVEASVVAITGADSFAWMKLCNKYTRFCVQIGGAIFCGYFASIFMAILSSISAFNLFRLYSPKQFLLLKPK
ncbi:hypothetical protein LguiA_010985 [Lonicera macranthoides]